MSRRASLLPWLSLFALYVVWGSTYLAIRIVVREMPPFAAASLRFLVASVLLGILALFTERRAGWPTRQQWIQYGIAGVFLLGLGNAGVMWAETRVPSGIAALLVATVPLWVTFLDGLRPGGEPWTARLWLGVLVGFAGVAFVARPQGGAGEWMGVGALQLAALAWTIGALYVKTIPKKLGTFPASAIEMLAGAAALLLESRLAGENLAQMATASRSAWSALAFLVVAGSLIGFTAFAYCLHEMPASIVGTYAYVNPVVAVLLGHALLDEPLSKGMLVGAALIVVGVVITTHRPSSPAPEPCES
jgi:drug/metabolite transporter (DMT)-like permease